MKLCVRVRKIVNYFLISNSSFFIIKYGFGSACDYGVIIRVGTILNWHLEDKSQHLFIMKDAK